MSITPLSKVIDVSFKLNETSARSLGTVVTGKQFSTHDTDAWLGFTFSDNNIAAGTYVLTLINLKDKSIFNHEPTAFTTNPFYYKLDAGADEQKNEIRHAGTWLGQLDITLENGDSATKKFMFDIEGHILDGAVVQTILLDDYNALIATINTSKDLLTQYNVDYAALLVDLAAAETTRTATYNQLVADQQANIDAFDVALETGIVAANLSEKLQDFETTNNSRLFSVEQQLEQKATIVDLELTNDEVDGRNYGLKPLTIKVPFGLNQPYHPSVVYIPEGWNGYKFWMVETPLPTTAPLYRDRYECPCIHVSNNGIDWIDPVGLINPIDDLTPEEITNEDYFSDTHMIYRADLGRLEVWYRIARRADTSYSPVGIPGWLIRKVSYDGVTWQTREVMNNFNVPGTPLYPMVRSQALIWTGTKYLMWFVDGQVNGLPAQAKTIQFSESIDGFNWTPKVTCTLWNSTINEPWHIDVQVDNGQYHMIVYQLPSDNGGIDNLTHFASTDGRNWNQINEILKGNYGNNAVYYQSLYRSCAVKVGTLWYVYVGATGSDRAYIGLMIGTALSKLNMYDGTFNVDKPYMFKGLRLSVDSKYGVHPLELEFTVPMKLEDINGLFKTFMQVASNNAFTIGNLTHTGDTVLFGGVGRKIKTDALLPNDTNMHDIGSPTAGYKNAYLRGFLKPGVFTTATRPTGAGTGAIIYDSTLAKPIYYDGISAWKDFAGNIV